MPGGGIDDGETPEQAALRELHEEVGLVLAADAVLGRLDDYATRSGYVITPVVVWAGQARDVVASAAEVASIHRIPVQELMREDAPLLDLVEGGRAPRAAHAGRHELDRRADGGVSLPVPRVVRAPARHAGRAFRSAGVCVALTVMRSSSLNRAVLPAAAACSTFPAAAGPADSTVWIEVSRPKDVTFSGYRLPLNGEGMGVVTPAGEVATAAHVVWGATAITVTDAKGGKQAARLRRIDHDVDAALLQVERPLADVARFRARPTAFGEPVLAVELRRANGAASIARGAISAARWTSHGVKAACIFTGIKGEKGMSGGGLFDERGELLGIIIRIDRTLGYLTALPVAELCARFPFCDASFYAE